MSQRDRMRAKAPFRMPKRTRPGRKPFPEADVPAAVRDFFEVGDGDALVFEEGSTFVAEKAAARGRYCVVYVERRGPEEVTAPPPVVESEPPRPAFTEPLEETIRRLRVERSR